MLSVITWRRNRSFFFTAHSISLEDPKCFSSKIAIFPSLIASFVVNEHLLLSLESVLTLQMPSSSINLKRIHMFYSVRDKNYLQKFFNEFVWISIALVNINIKQINLPFITIAISFLPIVVLKISTLSFRFLFNIIVSGSTADDTTL